jgi:hypothetical protein
MRITTTVQLDEGETLAYPLNDAAMQVLVALGGNAQNDYSELYLQGPNMPGTAGQPPPGTTA